jgi:hypothetical protein
MRETTMKQKMTVLGLVLGVALVVAGCSSDSPTAPKPSPTPGAYSITLTSSATSTQVGGVITVSAQLSGGAGSVPDNTSVVFALSLPITNQQCAGPNTKLVFAGTNGTIDGPSFENGFCQITRTTSGGIATAKVLSFALSGTFAVTAIVPGQKASLPVNLLFFPAVNPANLAIYGVTPNVGPASGGQQVTIQGKGFALPLSVDFIVAAQTRHAQVLSVNTSGTEMIVITPNADFLTATTAADVAVTAAVGETNETKDTLAKGYTFDVSIGPAGAPVIYQITPSMGLPTGNELVTITGQGFLQTVLVKLGTETADVISVSADNTTVVIKTRPHFGLPQNPGDAPVTVDVKVCTLNDCSSAAHSATRTGGWTWMVSTTQAAAPVIYQIIPTKGSARGGEDVKILGANLCGLINTTNGQCASAPTVTFSVGGAAQVLSYSADGKELHVITPVASVTPLLQDTLSDVTVTNSKGSATATRGFLFLADTRPPEVYSVSPNKGSARGGDTVTVFGRFLIAPVKVQFGAGRVAETISVSADGTSADVKTPAWGAVPLAVDTAVDVIVTTQTGTGRDQSVTLTNGFLYLAEQPTPVLYALAPNSGSVEGGTRITITGTGFQYPVQVLFGDRQAQVVSSNFNQVICVSPSITPTQPGTPTTVNVTVLNVESGKVSNALPYRYGEAMFISGIAPGSGPDTGGTVVTLFGQGFVGPVAVSLAGVAAEPLSVAGTEITVKSGRVPVRQCTPLVGVASVTNLSSGNSTTGASWTYLPALPVITGISVNGGGNTVPRFGSSCNVGPYTMTITGINFEPLIIGAAAGTPSNMKVSFASTPPIDVIATYQDANTITLFIPDLSTLKLATAACVTGTGAAGTEMVATGVDVTVTNMSSGCSNTLRGGLVVTPCAADGDTTCTAGPLAISCNANPVQVGVGMAVAFSATATGGTGVYSFAWTFGDTNTSNAQNPSHSYAVAGTYNASVTVNGAVCSPPSIQVLPLPVVVSLNPATGPAAGGTSVTITGSGFTGATTVTFGGAAATGLTVVNATTITCVSPAGAAGAAAVVVTTPAGVSNASVTFLYT